MNYQKFIYVNDTRTQTNWGCYSTSECFEKFFQDNELECKYRIMLKVLHNANSTKKLIDTFDLDDIDLVIVNGEGSIYDKQRKGLNICNAINWLKDKKPELKVFFLNSTYDLKNSVMTEYIKSVEGNVDLFAAREKFSIDKMKSVGIDNVILQPDFLYGVDRVDIGHEDYIVIGGNSNYNRGDRPKYNATDAYYKLINEIKHKFNNDIILYTSDTNDFRIMNPLAKHFNLRHIKVKTCNWKDALKILASAKLSISGRYHPSIMSVIGNTPSYFISANNCKMEGTCQLVYNNLDNFTNSHKLGVDVDKIVNWMESCFDNYDEEVDKVASGLNYCTNALHSAKNLIINEIKK